MLKLIVITIFVGPLPDTDKGTKFQFPMVEKEVYAEPTDWHCALKTINGKTIVCEVCFSISTLTED